MLSVRHRVGVAVGTLLALFVTLLVVQMVVGDRTYARHQQEAARLAAAREANVAVLQHMTDAETGVRGFQLTGERVFLAPYDSGRAGAATSLDAVTRHTSAPAVERLLRVEREAATRWMDVYAIPTVDPGAGDGVPAARGKHLFDRFRAANADVDAAIRAEQVTAAAGGRRNVRLTQLLFASLAVILLAVALGLAALHRRHLLAPLESLHDTLHRLAGGDRSARAVPAGPAEMRAVIGTLNDLATEIDRLLDAEQARTRRHELRQAVAAELRDGQDPETTARRLAETIGAALRADVAHVRLGPHAGSAVDVRWPAGAPALASRTVADVLAGVPGDVLLIEDVPGAIAVPLGGDEDCPPGLVHLLRSADPDWTGDERRLLAALGREIDHALRQRRLHDRQARLISELRTLDERKDAFVATVTHELRTPLTSILGYTEMLADGDGGDLSPPQRRGVTAILRNAMRLHETIADLLLLDRAGDPSAAPAPVDLAAAVAAVCADVTPAAHAKGLTVVVDAEPARVSGDARHLERALRNLLDNAVKFTAAGGSVTCRLAVRDGSACLEVTDTGIGIPAADLPGLFVPFHRAANAMDQAVQGSGLGLAIVRTIVTEHGGEVTARSALGRGSTFRVTLPAIADRVAPPESAAPEPVAAREPARRS
jgi:signal transduction histidine kinase/CHASE3 domain sensor protein